MKKNLKEAVEELEHWLQSEDPKYGELVMKILASLPGGERAEDAGYEPYDFLGWKELEMLTNLLAAIDGKEDVEEVVDALMGDDEDEDEE